MSRRLAPLLLLTAALLPSCDDTAFGESGTAADPGAWTCDSSEHSATFVIHLLAFAEQDDAGQAWGFDLDDHVSELGDSKGCGKQDFTDPEGSTGIDNAFAQLMPAVENTEAVAIKGLLQNAVDAGELLLMVQITGLDDPLNDDCVTVEFGQAVGTPMVGTDGAMLDGQSFARDPEGEAVVLEATEIVNGSLQARGLEFLLELQILDAPLAFKVADGALRIDLSEDGSSAWGYFGGGFSTDYVMEIVDDNAVDDTLTELLRLALPAGADLDGPEGEECSHMSVAFEYEAIPAFYYGE